MHGQLLCPRVPKCQLGREEPLIYILGLMFEAATSCRVFAGRPVPTLPVSIAMQSMLGTAGHGRTHTEPQSWRLSSPSSGLGLGSTEYMLFPISFIPLRPCHSWGACEKCAHPADEAMGIPPGPWPALQVPLGLGCRGSTGQKASKMPPSRSRGQCLGQEPRQS